MRYGTMNRNMFHAIVDGLGEDAARLIATRVMQQEGFLTPKYGAIPEGQLEALLNIIFRDISEGRLLDVLAGRLTPSWEEKICALITKDVRLFIPNGFGHSHVGLNRACHWKQPTVKFDSAAIIARGARFFPKGMKFPTAAEMENGLWELEEKITLDPRVSNLFAVKDSHRGIRLPWCLPQMDIDIQNPGKIIQKLFKPAIKRAYESEPGFYGRKFVDHHKKNTDGQVTIVHGSQFQLVAALRERPVFGWIFPAVFQGIGVNGARTLMRTLPVEEHNFVLGGFDSLAAMILYPAVLACCGDGLTPAMELAAFQWQDHERSFYFNASLSELVFDDMSLSPSEYYSAALSVFGQSA